jgi:glycosyltransferase involved in cell wall biosynthesis
MACRSLRNEFAMLPLTIWMNMPSFYQDCLFNTLSESGEVELGVVFARETTEDRLRLGWNQAVRNYSHSFLLSKARILDAARIAWSKRSRVHIINGIWAEPSFAVALCVLALARCKFVVYAEAPDPRRAQTGLRAFLRRLFAGWVAKRALGFFAVSRFAERFYTHIGFARERVYPFGYFQTHTVRAGSRAGLTSEKRTEVIFVGQLIHRKGVDVLLKSMQPMFSAYPDLRLSIIGSGEESVVLEEMARHLRIADRVSFEGTIGSETIQSRIALADVLVLPSRWDGWGIVVNEALSAGVPVIVSDRCGAADVVQHGINGYVFRNEDVDHLRACLQRFLDEVDDRASMRSAASARGQAVSAEVAATYMIKCLNHMAGDSEVRPTPPWFLTPPLQSPSQ